MAFSLSWTSIVFSALALIIATSAMGLFSRKNHFLVEGRTIVITGGSQGMGLSVGKTLAQKGANVVIVARSVDKLKAALAEISSAAANPETQRFHYISADLKSAPESVRIVEEVTKWNNNTAPDIVWCCAGTSYPELFLNMDIERLHEQMDSNYWTAAYLAHATLKSWLSTTPPDPDTFQRKYPPPPPKHIIFTASVLAFYPIIGYTQYAPAKAALRSLSDALTQELNLYKGARAHKATSGPYTDVKIATVFPATIFSPGYEKENLVKPAVTKKLEEDDGGQTPDEIAAIAVKALEKGEYLITTSLLGSAMRGSAWGGSPRNNWLVDTFMHWVTAIAWLFIQPDMDKKVRNWGKEHGYPAASEGTDMR